MKLLIEITMNNAAFDPNPELEVSRILRDYSNRIVESSDIVIMNLRDINGNKVGGTNLTEDY